MEKRNLFIAFSNFAIVDRRSNRTPNWYKDPTNYRDPKK